MELNFFRAFIFLFTSCFVFQAFAKNQSEINTIDAKTLTVESFRSIRENAPKSEDFIKDSDFEKAISEYFEELGTTLYKYETYSYLNKIFWKSATNNTGWFEIPLSDLTFSYKSNSFSDKSWVEKLIYWLPDQDNTYGLKFKLEEMPTTEAQTYIGKKHSEVIYYNLELENGKNYFGFWELKRTNGHVKTIDFLPARPVAVEFNGELYKL